MKNSIEIIFNDFETEDVSSFENLLIDAGYDFNYNDSKEKNIMGIDITILSIIIPAASTVAVALTEIIKAWLPNRSVEFTIKRKDGAEIVIKSQNGRIPKSVELEKISQFLEN